MDIVNITINEEPVKLWVENYLIVGALSKGTIFLDAYASLDDLAGYENDNANVTEVKGLSTTTLVDCLKTFKLDNSGVPYIAVEEAFDFYTTEGTEVVFKNDEFVAIILELDGSNTCFIKHEEYIDLVTKLTKLNPRVTYVKHNMLFDGDLTLDVNIENLKRELMESLQTVVSQAFTGESLKRLVIEYGGHSKFQRKKRVRITQERLEGLKNALRFNSPTNRDISLSGGVVLTEEVAFRTVNKFLPESHHVSSDTDRAELSKVVTEIITNLDAVRTYQLA